MTEFVDPFDQTDCEQVEEELSTDGDKSVERKTTGQAPQRKDGPNDKAEEAAEFIESLPDEEKERFNADLAARLVPASALETEPTEPAELGLEPDDHYRGHKILRDLPVQDERHAWMFDPATNRGRQPFYVLHSKREGDGDAHQDVIGLVPWLGSAVIWPWEKAWEQDLYHEKQTPEKQAIMAAFKKHHERKAKEAKR